MCLSLILSCLNSDFHLIVLVLEEIVLFYFEGIKPPFNN